MSNSSKPIKVSSLQDLADLAGVSRATVSRALSNSPLISAKTKNTIQNLAKQHNYTVNPQARNLRLRQTRIISVVFMLDIRSEQHMSDPFFLDMLGGIADALAEQDYDLLLAHAPITNILGLRDSRVFKQSDGVIFIGQGEQQEQLNELAEGDKPIVVWGYPVADKKYVVVGGENLSGGYQATKHLIEQQRHKIAFFGNTNNPENAARFEGYNKALAEANLPAQPDRVVDIPFEMNKARDKVMEIIQSEIELDAVVCATDVMALATISTLQELGFRIPQDIAVVGYDDISLAAYSSPPLTTIRQNIHWAGKVLAESILSLIRGNNVTDTTIATELIVRKSSCTPTSIKKR